MSSKETKLLLWSGAAAGGSGILWSLPILNVVSAISAIAGLLLVVARLGYLRAILISLLALVMASIVGYAIMGIELAAIGVVVVLIIVVIPGLAMGIAARSFSAPLKTVFLGCIPILLILAISAIYYTNLNTITTGYLRESNATVVSILDDYPFVSTLISQKYGVDADSREKMLEEMDKFLTLVIRALPGFIIFGFIALIIIGLMLAGKVAPSLGVMIPQLRPFYLWRASEWWLLPTVVGLVLFLFANELGKFIGLNMLVVAGHVYVFVGLAYIESFFRRISAPMIIRIAIYILLLLGSLPGMIFMAVFGLLDSRFKFRRENAEPGENNIE